MVVIDVFTRRLIGFGIVRGDLDGIAVCLIIDDVIANSPLLLEKCIHRRRSVVWSLLLVSEFMCLFIEEVNIVSLVPQSHLFSSSH